MGDKHDGLQQIIDEALEPMAAEATGESDPQHRNLAELCRRTGLSRQRARTIKADGFKVRPHGRLGTKAARTVLSGHTGLVDDQLRKGVTNSQAMYERPLGQGYEGGLTSVKAHVAGHRDLVPAKRRAVAPQGSRGQRFRSGPGEPCRMGWGLVTVVDWEGGGHGIACFAMCCHHCGDFYVEFFPNARQESLFMGMVHAFAYMGVPDEVLTDNMKGVVTRRGAGGRPVWNAEYAALMGAAGFRTRLCKPRRPFTKGRVERLVRFVKDDFLAGREFADLTRLDEDALLWCARRAGRCRRAAGCAPADEHRAACMGRARGILDPAAAEPCLCPRRRMTSDGFVSFGGRRFGVPWWYEGRECRVSREGRTLHIYSDDLSRELVCHEVTWSRRDAWCEGQWSVAAQPGGPPSQPVTTTVTWAAPPATGPAFARSGFGRAVSWPWAVPSTACAPAPARPRPRSACRSSPRGSPRSPLTTTWARRSSRPWRRPSPTWARRRGPRR